MAIQIAQEPHADQVLNADPFALVVGMMLDQQYPMDIAERSVTVRPFRNDSSRSECNRNS